VFAGYLFRDKATTCSFIDGVVGGWFRTGDTAVKVNVDAQLQEYAASCSLRAGLGVGGVGGAAAGEAATGGAAAGEAATGGAAGAAAVEAAPAYCYKILGRSSVDIIKSGGYKLSALEIESVLVELSYVCEAAVVGLVDQEWGECVAAALVVTAGYDESAVTLLRVRTDAKELMAAYKVPKVIRLVASLPRNAMGKVEKGKVKPLFET
jgi:acyl-CoA synthetase (AMP-forming)/AMP-acid ligase II